MTIGLVAVQGAWAPHAAVLTFLGLPWRTVRRPRDLRDVTGLVLPGGESTAQRRLLAADGLTPLLDGLVRGGTPTLLTCAGLVLGAAHIVEPDGLRGFGWIDVDVRRNGFGPQSESRVAVGDRSGAPLVLIRAPRIERTGASVTVLETLAGEPVLVRSGNVTAATYHPELTDDHSVHAACFAVLETCPR